MPDPNVDGGRSAFSVLSSEFHPSESIIVPQMGQRFVVGTPRYGAKYPGRVRSLADFKSPRFNFTWTSRHAPSVRSSADV